MKKRKEWCWPAIVGETKEERERKKDDGEFLFLK
jgi:hypothetical protein